MQRLFPLATMILIAGGGWFLLAGEKPTDRNAPPSGAPAGAYSSPRPGYPVQPAQGPAIRRSQPAAAIGLRRGAPPPQQAPTIRLASFNIQVFGDAKADKPYVMDTLAAIVRQFHLVAIQEIRSQDDYLLDRFLEYLNRGGARYDYIIGPRLGRTRSTEQYAFVYDTSAIEVNRHSIYTVRDPDDLLHREPLVAMFRARGPKPEEAFTFILINVHTDPDETDTELDALGQVYQVVRRNAGGEDDIILLGDLNVDDQNLGLLGRISGVRPLVTGVFTNTRQTKLYDNIVLHRQATSEFTGRWGVYDIQRLHNLTLDQALQVSDHLPVWAEFSAYESAAPGRVAIRSSMMQQ